MARTIWFSNRNFRFFHVNGKSPWKVLLDQLSHLHRIPTRIPVSIYSGVFSGVSIIRIGRRSRYLTPSDWAENQKFSGTNQKSERRRLFGTGLVRHCPQGLFSPFFTFLRAIFFRPFWLSLAPTIYPWVSEDGVFQMRTVFNLGIGFREPLTRPGFKLDEEMSICSLNFIRLLLVVFSSQQHLNRPAINAVQWRHYPTTWWWFWLVDCLNIRIIMCNYEKFSEIVAWYSADRIPGILSSNISISLIFIVNSTIALSSKLKW